MKYLYTVEVEAETEEEAETVMAERLNYEEDYGFEYTITKWDTQEHFPLRD